MRSKWDQVVRTHVAPELECAFNVPADLEEGGRPIGRHPRILLE
jgi:hypothetical protein